MDRDPREPTRWQRSRSAIGFHAGIILGAALCIWLGGRSILEGFVFAAILWAIILGIPHAFVTLAARTAPVQPAGTRRGEPEPDYLLWGLLTLGFGGVAAVVQYILMPKGSFLDICTRIAGGDQSGELFLIAAGTALWLFLPPSAIVGWFAHRLIVRCGLRLTGRTAPLHAADYDDAPIEPPGP